MRRIILSLTVIAVALLVSTSVALAATKNCPYSGDCFGTSSADTLYGTKGQNYIYGLAGKDTIYGYAGNDSLEGGDGNDVIRGGKGDDYLFGEKGDDYLNGGPGDDIISGYTGKDKLYDTSSSSNDWYWQFFLDNDSEDRGVVRDSGGSSDVIEMEHLSRSEVFMTWVDTTYDSDTKMDALLIEWKGTSNTVLVRNYFDNSGGTSKGTGAIESIKFEDKTVGFPASEG